MKRQGTTIVRWKNQSETVGDDQIWFAVAFMNYKIRTRKKLLKREVSSFFQLTTRELFSDFVSSL